MISSQQARTGLTAGLLILVSSISHAAVFQVTHTGDSGPGSLRQALVDANALAGIDQIHFAIPGNGPHVIHPASPLPGITSPVSIDGYTQPGAMRNSGANGSNAVILIEVRGNGAASPSAFNLLTGSSGSAISGLAINRTGIAVNATLNATNCVIAGNFIGTDVTGTIGYVGEQSIGISVTANGCRIGGPLVGDRNIVSAMSQDGIYVNASDVAVQGNLIGTDRNMSVSLGNQGSGIVIGGSTNAALRVRVGGRNEGAELPRNVIGGNRLRGILVRAGSSHVIEGNFIGLASFSLTPLPNDGPGILVNGGDTISIGNLNSAHGNTIAHNTGPGILVTGAASNAAEPQRITMIGNTIRNNGQLSIDLAADGIMGPDPVDPLDSDAGPNTLQNHPVLMGVVQSGGQLSAHGLLHSTPSTTFDIDLYHSYNCGAQGRGEAATYLGFINVTTDAGGDAVFAMPVQTSLTQGYLSATASHSTGVITSEFSPCLRVDDVIFANGFQ